METHTKGAPERLPRTGDTVETRRRSWQGWYARTVDPGDVFEAGGGYRVDDGLGWAGPGHGTGEGTGWRWPEAGAVRVEGEGFRRHDLRSHGEGWKCSACGVVVLDVDPAEAFRAECSGPGLPVGEVPSEIDRLGWEARERRAQTLADVAGAVLALGESVGLGPHRQGEASPARCRCGVAAVEVRPGMPAGRVACVGCGAERPDPAPERLISQGGAGRTEWRLSCRAGVYTGKVVIGGELAASFTGVDCEDVTGKMMAKIDAMLDPRDTRVPYVAPAVQRVQTELAPRLALNTAASRSVVRMGDVTNALARLRKRLFDDAAEWLEEDAGAWDRLADSDDVNPRMIQRARELHAQRLVLLFERIGAAL